MHHAKQVAVDGAKDALDGAKDLLRDAKDATLESYEYIKDQAVDSVVLEDVTGMGRRARRAGRSASQFVSVNALPLSLMGLGLGWLMLAAGHRQRIARATLGDAREKMMDRAGEVRSQVMQGAAGVRRRAVDVGHEAYDQLGRVGTGKENRLMGGTRDRLLDSARDTASQLGRSVQQGAGELKQIVTEQARAH